jgi:hypothetical protein
MQTIIPLEDKLRKALDVELSLLVKGMDKKEKRTFLVHSANCFLDKNYGKKLDAYLQNSEITIE